MHAWKQISILCGERGKTREKRRPTGMHNRDRDRARPTAISEHDVLLAALCESTESEYLNAGALGLPCSLRASWLIR